MVERVFSDAKVWALVEEVGLLSVMCIQERKLPENVLMEKWAGKPKLEVRDENRSELYKRLAIVLEKTLVVAVV